MEWQIFLESEGVSRKKKIMVTATKKQQSIHTTSCQKEDNENSY